MSHVSDPHRDRIRELIDEYGEREAARLLGLVRHTMVRVVAGLPVRAGTVALVAQAVEALDHEQAA